MTSRLYKGTLLSLASGLLAALVSAELAAQQENVFLQKPTVAASVVVGTESKDAPKPKGRNTTKLLSGGPEARWIWGPGKTGGKDAFVFRREFEGRTKKASLVATCDNQMVIILNGKRLVSDGGWESPARLDIQENVKAGKNLLEIHASNSEGPAGLAVKLALTDSRGTTRYLISDKRWQVAKTANSKEWVASRELGKMGMQPWGNVFSVKSSVATASQRAFNVLPGFQVELLYTVPKGSQGSWVSIAFDNKGRLIASDQGAKGLYRITPPPIGSQLATRVEKLTAKITSAQGMLYAFDSLYISVNGGPGSGLYRARDTNGDDQYDEVKLLKKIQGGGEHGPHALRLSPDGKSIYLVAGNHTNPPEKFDSSRMKPNWSEDLLLPRQWDARGHARGKLAPGGWVAKTDPEGKTWEIISNGYRNSYDMDFSPEGELFVYDADMEWDFGAPWYRPTRVLHAVSGSEFGWRSGTGKWPTYYVDSLPEVVNIGPGSPVGVAFGTGAKFPAKYQRALYLLDWTFGTMYAIHLKEDGASYRGVREEFVSRTPLPLTDAAVGPDGALYFTIGGRGAQSELYRVTYVGEESTAAAAPATGKFAELRALRRKLEGYHGSPNPKAVEAVWDYLGHEDRHIRFAARTALENQPAGEWQQRVLQENDPQTLITAGVALARQGDTALQGKLLANLQSLGFKQLTKNQQLELLRLYALSFVRMGQPDQATADAIARSLDPHYPSGDMDLDRELSRVLVYLNSPTVITKTLALMEKEYEVDHDVTAELLARNAGYGGTIAKMLANTPDLQKIHYALVLRNMRFGWTLDQRKVYFNWFNGALKRNGGASYQGFINNIRKEALANVSESEKKALAATTLAPPPKLSELPKPKGPGHKWTLGELVSASQTGLRERSFENGKRMFAAARCLSCHRFDGNGGATGSDLSNVAGRFSVTDLSDSIINPSKVISDQYRAMTILTVAGKVITGRIVGDDKDKIVVMTDPFDATKIVEIAKGDIDATTPSKVSLMPTGLIEKLNRDEVLDLLAYMLSRGNANDQIFRK
jgi:putative heme-binding domain-containing protein